VLTVSLLLDLSMISELGLKVKKGGTDSMVAFALGHPYPLCTVFLQDLYPMKFSDLRMDTHHRGCVLIVRRVAPVAKLVAFS